MSITNFKLFTETVMKDRLDKIKSGEIRLGVSNQHDVYVLESALDNLDAAIESAYDWFNVADYGYSCTRLSAMCIAHHLSNFEVEELSSAWID
jgi:hypothetical protein